MCVPSSILAFRVLKRICLKGILRDVRSLRDNEITRYRVAGRLTHTHFLSIYIYLHLHLPPPPPALALSLGRACALSLTHTHAHTHTVVRCRPDHGACILFGLLVSDSVRRNSKRSIRHISVYCTECQGFSYDFWLGIKLILATTKN